MSRRVVVAVFLISLGAAAQARADGLNAGVAVADITPPPEYRMSGYFSERVSTGTHDPLNAKALYLSQGNEQAVLVFCDLVGIPLELSSQVRETASDKTGIPQANILIAATHSHTGPLYFGPLRRHFHDTAIAKNGSDPYEEVDYPSELIDKLVNVICRARNGAMPIRMETGVGRAGPLAFNRRFHMKDGSVVFNPGKLNPNIVRAAGPTDPDARVIMLRSGDEARPVASLTVFALHLDTVGGTEYSADYPYYYEQSLQKRLGSDFVSLFGAGTCGDINHIDVTHDRPQKGHEEAERIGTILADSMASELDRLTPVKYPSLAVKSAKVEAPLQRFTEEQFEQAMQDLHKVGTRDLPFLKQVEAYKIVAVHRIDGDKLPMEVQVFRLGDELAIVGLPGEIFVELGLAIKKASPFKNTLVVELCNDAPGYVPTRRAFAEGSYETVNSRIQSGGGEMLVETATQLLMEIKE
jgi:neutral ceramidase